jgi:hypothetical protein
MLKKLARRKSPPTPNRPHDSEADWARKRARRASWVVLLPFALAALGLGLGLRLFNTYRATGDLTEIAQAVEAKEDTQKITGTPALVGVVERELKSVSQSTDNACWAKKWKSSWFLKIVEDPCHDTSTETDSSTFCYKTYQLLLRNGWATATVQGILIFLIPAFFLNGFFQSADQIKRHLAASSPPSLAEKIWYDRHKAALQRQGDSFFWRRLGFAALLAYGCAYLLAPLGIKASVIGDYMAMNALPGETSHPLLLTSFGEAPPFTVGFAGFFLYSITVVVRRSITHDLHDRIFPQLFLRGITVLLLSLVLSSLDDKSVISNALIFAVGIFPQAGIQAIAKLTQTTVDRLTNEGNEGFTPVPEIDFWKATTLQELGIESYHDLAKADLKEVLLEVGMNPLLLMRATDRAVLFHMLGPAAERLTAIPVHTASELVLYTRGPDACPLPQGMTALQPPRFHPLTPDEQAYRESLVEEVMQVKDACLQIEQLATDRNVQFILRHCLYQESA